MENDTYPYVNLPLPYALNALEPYIDTKTMEIHYGRQLPAYINRLNAILKDFPELQSMTLEELIVSSEDLYQNGLKVPVQNYAGGVYNHRFYFNGMAPPSNLSPRGILFEMIESQYGNYTSFKEVFKFEGMKVFGSGYAWLVYDDGVLRIVTTPNQNNPIAQGYCPILALDVWEHAYFLKHYNLRANYIEDWFRVINWDEATKNYLDCVNQQKEKELQKRSKMKFSSNDLKR